jgi:hypothetical protein
MFIIVMIILICVIAATFPVTQKGGSSLQPGPIASGYIDQLRHASEGDISLKNRVVKTIELPLPELKNFAAPEAHTSPTVVKELVYLEKLNKQKNTPPYKFGLGVRTVNDVVKKFTDYAGGNGLIYSLEHIQQVGRDVETIVHLVKSYYGRPRPYQLGFVLGYNIKPAWIEKSSSYPCEITTVAKVIAHVLSYNNPQAEEVMESLFKQIEISRYYTGLNFPSDTVAAHRLADIIAGHVQYLEINRS